MVVTDDSTDTRLHFQLKWTAKIPNGKQITYRRHEDRSERDPKDTKKTPVKSMDYVQNVTYVPSATAAAGTPSISGGVKFENEGDAATWKSGSTLNGTATGSKLDKAKPAGDAGGDVRWKRLL